MQWIQRSLGALLVAGTLSLGFIGPAAGQAQLGLVNVNVGDVTILKNVQVGVAAQLAANICGLDVGPVVLLGVLVAQEGDEVVVCTIQQGDQQVPVTIQD